MMKVTIIDFEGKGVIYKEDRFLWYYTSKSNLEELESIISKLDYMVYTYTVKSETIKEIAKILIKERIPVYLSEWDFAIKRANENNEITDKLPSEYDVFLK
jgi:hypothetical protein